jgi:hypothetical protein
MPDLQTWSLQCPQTAYGKELLILQTFETALPPEAQLRSLRPELELGAHLAGLDLERAWAIQFRFGRQQQFENEGGSTCDPEALCKPLVHAMAGGPMAGERTLAAPFLAVDRIAGPCAGGRWVFAPCQSRRPLPVELIARLIDFATRSALQLEVAGTLACYHKGERTTIRVAARCRRRTAVGVRIRVEHQGREVFARELSLVAWPSWPCVPRASRPRSKTQEPGMKSGGEASVIEIAVPAKAPGLYTVTATAWEEEGTEEASRAKMALRRMGKMPMPHTGETPVLQRPEPLAFARGGFWVADAALMARPKALTVNRDYFLRDGKPYPVAGTTYMCGEVWRHFLFDPRPAQWEDDFAAMKAAGVNMVRTGVWTGWSRMVDRRGVREPVLRAFEAWLLTAARYDMPVIFTFFAFTPPQWGGKNCYLDPASLEAQERYVGAFAKRFAGAAHLMYDFINEPSFGCPERLWRVTPNYDAFDRQAWEAWSRDRCGDDEELAQRWRRASVGDRSLPELRDFEDRHTFQGARPMAAGDYRLYGQEMFNRWTARMTRAVRRAGSRQLLTVGQDEGATADRPNPWFHGPLVDFTTNHSWWFNDDLLWDSVITKTPGRPNLIEETGMMFFERPSGDPARTLDDCRDLLERKMAFSLAGGCAGFIQWLWKTDPLMPIDNESAVGFYHVDGSEKPELEAFRRVARFFAQAGPHMVGRRAEEVCVVLPHSLMFSVRNLATAATRQAVRTLEYRLGVPCRAVAEHCAAQAKGAKLIILPSPRVLSEECWQALLKLTKAGATLLVTGFVEADEYWRPADRLAAWDLHTAPHTVSREERVAIPGGQTLEFTFAGEHQHRGEKAVPVGPAYLPDRNAEIIPGSRASMPDLQKGAAGTEVRILPHGRGKIVYCPVPAELAQGELQTAGLYRFAAAQAGIECPAGSDAALLVRPVEFGRATLYLLVNESGRAQKARLVGPAGAWRHAVAVEPGRIAMALIDRKSGKVLAEMA